jgi:hypothetical protein
MNAAEESGFICKKSAAKNLLNELAGATPARIE